MSTSELQSEESVLTEETTKDIYNKIDDVKKEIYSVNGRVGEILLMIGHFKDGHKQIEEVLEKLESILYGKDMGTGFLARIQMLERAEVKRERMMGGLWVAIGGLIIEVLIRHFAS